MRVALSIPGDRSVAAGCLRGAHFFTIEFYVSHDNHHNSACFQHAVMIECLC